MKKFLYSLILGSVLQLNTYVCADGLPPTVIQSDGSITINTNGMNNYTLSTASNAGVVVNAQIWVDLNGHDNIAIRGRRDLPFATLTNALLVAQAGDIVQLGEGTFLVTNQLIPINVTINGMGSGSIISTPSASSVNSLLIIQTGVELDNLVMVCPPTPALGNLYPILFSLDTVTNVTLKNIVVYGLYDCIMGNTGGGGPYIQSLSAYHCSFFSQNDAGFFNMATGSTNTFDDCFFSISATIASASFSSLTGCFKNISAVNAGVFNVFNTTIFLAANGTTQLCTAFAIRGSFITNNVSGLTIITDGSANDYDVYSYTSNKHPVFNLYDNTSINFSRTGTIGTPVYNFMQSVNGVVSTATLHNSGYNLGANGCTNTSSNNEQFNITTTTSTVTLYNAAGLPWSTNTTLTGTLTLTLQPGGYWINTGTVVVNGETAF
jgi:hypothetical protein